MKKTAVWLRLFCLTLILCIAAGALVACTGNPDQAEQTTAPPKKKPAYRQERLDREVNILYSSEAHKHIVGDEQSSVVFEKDAYSRYNTVAQNLACTFNWVGVDTSAASGISVTDLMKKVSTAQDGKEPFDALLIDNLYAGALTSVGLSQNLYDTPFMDEDFPYTHSYYLQNATTETLSGGNGFNRNIPLHLSVAMPLRKSDYLPLLYMEDMTVNGKLYSIADCANVENINKLQAVFYLVKLVPADPYQMVENNTWTFANMAAMLKDCYKDLNDNKQVDAADFFGAVSTPDSLDAWFYAMGYRYSAKDDKGNVKLNLSNTSYITKWSDEFNQALSADSFLVSENAETMFLEERTALIAGELKMAYKMAYYVAGEGHPDYFNYGVVPMPKQNAQQEHYYSALGDHHLAWMMPIHANKLESSMLVDHMMRSGYINTFSSYFYHYLCIRYAPYEHLADMYDLIRASMTVDICRQYSLAYDSGAVPAQMLADVTLGGKAWSEVWGEAEQDFTAEFEQLMAYRHPPKGEQ